MKLIKLLSMALLCTCLSITVVLSQDKVGDIIALSDVPESKALVSATNTYSQAIIAGDHDKVADLTHADIISMGGGAEFLIQDLDAERSSLQNSGLTYDRYEVGTHPEFLQSEGQLQTVIPVTYYLKMDNKPVESWINLFAVSTDEGKSWKFVNLEKFDDESLKAFVSNVSPDFVYPK